MALALSPARARDRWIACGLGAASALLLAPASVVGVAVSVSLGGIAGFSLYQLGRRLLTSTRCGWLSTRFRRDAHHPHLRFTFTALGKLAKCGGAVQPEHIDYVENLMSRLGFNADQRSQAIEWFRQGKQADANLAELGKGCRRVMSDRSLMDDMALESLCALSRIAPARQTRETLTSAVQALGVSAERVHAVFDGLAQKRQHSDAQLKLDNARCLLGVDADADEAAIKLAYRRQVAELHPDKMLEASSSEIKRAEKQLTLLRDAYERLLALS